MTLISEVALFTAAEVPRVATAPFGM